MSRVYPVLVAQSNELLFEPPDKELFLAPKELNIC